MNYLKPSFSVPATSGNGVYDKKTGHCGPDSKGRCQRMFSCLAIALAVAGCGPDKYVEGVGGQCPAGYSFLYTDWSTVPGTTVCIRDGETADEADRPVQ